MRYIMLCLTALFFVLPTLAQEDPSPPSGEIMFTSKRDGDIHHIFIMNADGSNLRQFTSGPLDSFTGVWSPDGTKIAFRQEAVQDAGIMALWVMNADGSNAIEIAREENGQKLAISDGWLSWSPDSTRFLYRRFYDMKFMELVVVNADGTDAQTLVPDVGLLGEAYFLTNEALVIMDDDYSTEKPHVLRYDLADGTITPLAEYGSHVIPSPDGTMLALMDDQALAVIDVATGEKRIIQETLASDENRLLIYELSWSDDSSTIAGTMTNPMLPPAFDRLFVAKVDGTRYAVFEVADRHFSLSPDGDYVAYSKAIPYSPIEQDIGYQLTISRTDGQGTPIQFEQEEFHSQPEWRPLP